MYESNGTGVATYDLWNYFDLDGNPEDGWEVNNLCCEANGICITDDATEQDILDYLVSIGFLSTSDPEKVSIDSSCGEMIEIYQVEGDIPLGSLRLAC